MLNLSIHQGSALQAYGDITASYFRERNGKEMDKEMAGDLSTQLSSLDDTNACVLLSIVVADWLRQNGSRLELPMNAAYIQKTISKKLL